ncbi:MAG TPA: hypothetical protein VN132_06545 [Bdellovibrio sp.]|nr:hypothetical protein [Bdellovibrio sp.]
MKKIFMILAMFLINEKVLAFDAPDVLVKNFFSVRYADFEGGNPCPFYKKYFINEFLSPQPIAKLPDGCYMFPVVSTRFPQVHPNLILEPDDDLFDKIVVPKLIAVKVESLSEENAVVSASFSKGQFAHGYFKWPAVKHLFYLKKTLNGWRVYNILWQLDNPKKEGDCGYQIFDSSQKEFWKKLDELGCPY